MEKNIAALTLPCTRRFFLCVALYNNKTSQTSVYRPVVTSTNSYRPVFICLRTFASTLGRIPLKADYFLAPNKHANFLPTFVHKERALLSKRFPIARNNIYFSATNNLLS
jgi:hypothetical protein